MIGNRGVSSRTVLYRRPNISASRSTNEYELAIYNSNVTVSNTFWDWRHKTLTLYLSLMTAIGAIVAWLYQKSPHEPYLGLPLVAASGISYIAYRWERRVREIIDMSVGSCAHMEERWCAEGRVGKSGSLSAFTMLNTQSMQGKVRTFSTTIPILFGVLGVGSLVLACLIFANAGA
jgi:hypothetical protein